jgi:hypothetical protein
MGKTGTPARPVPLGRLALRVRLATRVRLDQPEQQVPQVLLAQRVLLDQLDPAAQRVLLDQLDPAAQRVLLDQLDPAAQRVLPANRVLLDRPGQRDPLDLPAIPVQPGRMGQLVTRAIRVQLVPLDRLDRPGRMEILTVTVAAVRLRLAAIREILVLKTV